MGHAFQPISQPQKPEAAHSKKGNISQVNLSFLWAKLIMQFGNWLGLHLLRWSVQHVIYILTMSTVLVWNTLDSSLNGNLCWVFWQGSCMASSCAVNEANSASNSSPRQQYNACISEKPTACIYLKYQSSFRFHHLNMFFVPWIWGKSMKLCLDGVLWCEAEVSFLTQTQLHHAVRYICIVSEC